MPQQDSDTPRCSTASQDTPAPSVDALLTDSDIERLAYLRLHHGGMQSTAAYADGTGFVTTGN